MTFAPLPLDVSRETKERLQIYAEQVRRWSGTINLVSRSTLDAVWKRHIVDSAQVFTAAEGWMRWVDLGAGGGFPGLVVAILSADTDRSGIVTLVESDQRKCAFLRNVIRELDLNVTVIARRIEEVPPLGAEVVSARALAPLGKLLGYCARHVDPDGSAILLKGKTWKSEVDDARVQWSFSCEVIQSLTGAGAVVLKVRNIERV